MTNTTDLIKHIRVMDKQIYKMDDPNTKMQIDCVCHHNERLKPNTVMARGN